MTRVVQIPASRWLIPVSAILAWAVASPAWAIIGDGPGYSSRVDSTVTPQAAQFRYDFTVFNTSEVLELAVAEATLEVFQIEPGEIPVIVDWELPIFSLSDVAGLNPNDPSGAIDSPDGWAVEVIPPDSSTDIYNNVDGPYGPYSWDYDAATDPAAQAGDYGPNPEVFNDPPWIIHWYLQPNGPGELPAGIFPGDSLDGFGFVSDYSEQAAPYLSSWFFLPPALGDPPIPNDPVFSTPNSPERQQAQRGAIPEPASLAAWALVLGVAIAAGLIRRRRLGR